MGAPPSAGGVTAVQVTVAVVPALFAAAPAGVVGATATPRHAAQVTEPKSVPVLVTVTSTDAGDVRLTVTGTVRVAPELETVAVFPPGTATPDPDGKLTVAPVRKPLPVRTRSPL